MTLTKKDIIKSISNETSINSMNSKKIFESFIKIIKQKSKTKKIKISGFGSFEYRKTPKRVGRNPKTKESYIISPRKKIQLTISNKIKKILN